MREQSIHIQLRHASEVDTTNRPRVYVEVGPGYPMAVLGKTMIAGHPCWSQTVVFIWRMQGILDNLRVAGRADQFVGGA